MINWCSCTVSFPQKTQQQHLMVAGPQQSSESGQTSGHRFNMALTCFLTSGCGWSWNTKAGRLASFSFWVGGWVPQGGAPCYTRRLFLRFWTRNMRLLVDSNDIEGRSPPKTTIQTSLNLHANCLFKHTAPSCRHEACLQKEVIRSPPAAQADILNRLSFDLKRWWS